MTDKFANCIRTWPRRFASLAGAAAFLSLLCGTPACADSAMPSTTEAPAANYSDPGLWICRPGRADACAANLDATIIAKDGSTTREAFRADPDAAIDCFYAYPTVSSNRRATPISQLIATSVAQSFSSLRVSALGVDFSRRFIARSHSQLLSR